ncbi:MAG: hypothetical protein LAP85_08540 [Acidobacteriia bacterium]|nr:hypothetical protein [Terriglobia bacterium]
MLALLKILPIATGAVAGLIVSSWQGFKDPPWEGFFIGRFFRSILVGAAAGAVLSYAGIAGIRATDNLGIFAFAIVAVERVVDEAYKGFFRKGAHGEYYKLLNRMRVPADARVVKVLLGVGFVIGSYWLFRLLAWWLARMVTGSANLWLPGLIVGAAGGLLVAIGGALKDSQFEGFIPAKFVRSPIVSAMTGMLFIRFSTNWFVIALAAVGGERVGVELYKTFLKRQVRGMHANKPVSYPVWLARRWIFALSYGIAVLVCIILLVAQLQRGF